MTSAQKDLLALLDPEEFAYMTGVTLRGFTVSQGPEGWNLIFRAFLRGGQAVYTMTQGDDLSGGLSSLLALASGRDGLKCWHRDKFYYLRS